MTFTFINVDLGLYVQSRMHYIIHGT